MGRLTTQSSSKSGSRPLVQGRRMGIHHWRIGQTTGPMSRAPLDRASGLLGFSDQFLVGTGELVDRIAEGGPILAAERTLTIRHHNQSGGERFALGIRPSALRHQGAGGLGRGRGIIRGFVLGGAGGLQGIARNRSRHNFLLAYSSNLVSVKVSSDGHPIFPCNPTPFFTSPFATTKGFWAAIKTANFNRPHQRIKARRATRRGLAALLW